MKGSRIIEIYWKERCFFYESNTRSLAVASDLRETSSHGNFPKLKVWVEDGDISLQHFQLFVCQVEKMPSLRRRTFIAWFAHSATERYLKSFGVSLYQLSLDWISFLSG